MNVYKSYKYVFFFFLLTDLYLKKELGELHLNYVQQYYSVYLIRLRLTLQKIFL